MAKDWSTLTKWTEKAIGLSEVRVQVRLRGNHLHVLCEGSPCPPEKVTVSQFSTALEQTNLSPLLPPDMPTIYKVFLCGRQPGAKRPEWTVKLECNTTQIVEAQTPTSQLSTTTIGSTTEATASIATEQISVWKKLGGILGRRPSRTKDEPSTKPVLLQTTETTEPQTSEPEPVEVALTSTPLSGEHPNQPEPPPIPEKPALTTEEIKTPSRPITTQAKPPEQIPVTLTVPTETLARRGYPDAIASYLSEILGSLGVSVKVSVKELSKKHSSSTTKLPTPSKNCRLWVRCESAYSPDPSLLAEPIAERLRKLQLKNFRDACILLQVQGESKPDWMLRIDLTPTLEILKNWARWGSASAIARILNQELQTLDVKVRATLKESTLHLFCETLTPDNGKKSRNAPPKAKVMAAIAPILNTLAPQGILAATVYGVNEENQNNLPDSPVWIDWLNLPANQHPDLQPHPLILAQQGNLDALKFLLNQQINPDLDTQLATGGVRVLLLRKGKLLHVMTEAPTCPSQSKIAPALAQFLRSHPLEGVAGVRIYGRRAGQKHPLWRYGVALSQRVQAPEEQVDAFAAEENQDLVSSAEGLILRPDLASEELESSESDRSPRLRVQWRDALELLSTRLQQGLIATGLITNRAPILVSVESGGTSRYSKTGMAVVWGAVGCLLALQIDWALGQFLQSNPQLTATTPEVNVSEEATIPPTVSGMEAASASIVQPSQNDQGFTRSEFITSTNTTQYKACKTASDSKTCQLSDLLHPSFNSPQLDEQLARYQDYLLKEKRPPDILIVGSSRALRGIDPTVLEKALADVGYPRLKVFNFGVNGATAQVVELIVRHILPPEQLPKLVIVADGVRALNSGRSDRTYEALTASPGYQQIAQGTFRIPTRQLEGTSDFQQTLMTLQELSQNPSTTLKQIQQWFDQQFVEISASYPRRDQLKQYLLAVVNNQSLITPRQELPDLPAPEDHPTLETPEIQRNGFLPLSIQFDPETYYQKYAQVSGYYDSDYQSFELDGVQMNALKKLIEYVQSQQVEIVFVNMPLTQEYLDSVRTAYEEKFLNYMKTVEAETGLTFVNLAYEWLNTNDYFSDPSHLNQYGAAAVAKQLAEKSQISWSRRAK